ncbi:prolyl 4-hydroxylase subunit alpha-1-like isoform X2 [Amphiura filiformis]|uniref:prolyl 4-hydroxylase subunit alpha-1-like isoform X2 n=1 Tax=Amphiura filiformis TaxID=82378 RepID=UPI003B219011
MLRDIAVVIFLTCIVCIMSQNLFTSFDKLKPLITTEKELLGYVDEYIQNEEDKIEKIESLLSEIKKERGVKTDLGNPVQSYMLIRRLTRQWVEMDELIGSNKNAEDYRLNIAMLKSSAGESYPSEIDYQGAMDALLRLQDTYDLGVSDIADGHIGRNKSSAPLKAIDCFDLGVKAWEVSTSENVCHWMHEAQSRLSSDTDYLIPNISTHMIECSKQKKEEEEVLKLDPEVLTCKNYEALCRGEDIGVKHATNLFCRYNHYNKPRLFIRPAKEELVSHEPRVVLFHDALTDKETNLLIAKAKPQLRRAQIRKFAGSTTTIDSKTRISSNAWLPNINDELGLQSVLPRVQDYTGLSTDQRHTEPFQVANYGLGGFYKYHRDDYTEGIVEDTQGKRIATVLFYLSEVEAGGFTVFPELGIYIPPVKGSAAFWYNYLKNGKSDPDMLHAGCPVLLGEKWASNLWIHEYGQEFRRRCGLTEDDIY